MKKLTAWLGALVLIMLMAGCSSKPKPVSGEAQTVAPVTPIEPAPEQPQEKPAEKPQENTAETDKKPTEPYELTRFTGEFKSYQAGDIVPKLYRSEQYNIKKWQLRKLPAPVEGSHWTYFGGAYVEITDSDGMIGRMYSGDNIYR
jgi:nickel/cobalt homeostasis protein